MRFKGEVLVVRIKGEFQGRGSVCDRSCGQIFFCSGQYHVEAIRHGE